MHNPFAKPETPGQWLLSSVLWAVGCCGIWLAISAIVLEAPYNQKTPSGPVFFISFAAAYSMIWWKAIPGLKAVETGASLLEMFAFIWQIVLIAFQLIWLIIMLVLLISPWFYDPTQELLRQ
jgi:hypothetical protein